MSPMIRIVKVLIRDLATRGRVIALGGLGLLAVVLGAAVRTADPFDRPDAAWSLVNGYGLALLVPVVTLVFASAALGDPAEDGTLVYLWLRPLPRWKLAVSAFVAAVAVAVPVAVVPLVLGAALTGEGVKIVAGAAAGGLLAVAGYAAVFCGLGLRVKRALAWGIAYLLIWEQAVARLSHGAARASLFVNAHSVMAYIADHPHIRLAVSPVTGVIVPLSVCAVALVATTRLLDRGDVA
jgi:ABC-2 type transport system permease protein